MTPEQSRLIHFATVASVIRFTVDELRHSYNPEYRTAHINDPEFDDVRDMVSWYAYGFTQSFCAKYRSENVRDVLSDGPWGIERLWRRVGQEIKCSDLAGECRCQASTGRRSNIIGLTEEEQAALIDANQKMRLAITVGYIL